MRCRWLILFLLALVMVLPGCMAVTDPAMLKLAREPLSSEPWMVAESPWEFNDQRGWLIQTTHFQIHTTIDNPLYQHLLGRVLEATYQRHQQMVMLPEGPKPAFDCYVLASRSQWEHFTRMSAGSNAPIYLQIESGGYSQKGVFVGYDVGLEQTLSVVAHEAWHQYSWYAFKDRLPSWLEEGLATQNEAIVFNDAAPQFVPGQNRRRMASLQAALRGNGWWKLPELVSVHAGQVITQPQARIDAYYAQLWSLTQFLQQSPRYAPRLKVLLADAAAGTLTRALAGTSVTPAEIKNYSEHWNAVAGPVYLEKYINGDMGQLEGEYLDWAKDFVRHAP